MEYPTHRSSDPDESRQPFDKETIRRECMKYIVANEGITSGELQTLAARDGANLSRQESLRKRLHEIERDGFIKRGPPRKDPASGRQQATWWLKDERQLLLFQHA